MGETFLAQSFLAVILGGVGNLFGIIGSAFAISGVRFALSYFIRLTTAQILVFVMAILVIRFRPQGLLPNCRRDRIDTSAAGYDGTLPRTGQAVAAACQPKTDDKRRFTWSHTREKRRDWATTTTTPGFPRLARMSLRRFCAVATNRF